MVSHVGPRAGCGCCMPCEVVACIVVLPMPVGILLHVLARFWSVSTSMFAAIMHILLNCCLCSHILNFMDL